MLTIDSNTPLAQALRLAQDRGLLPTSMGSRELSELLQRMEERLFFSARTSNLWYVDQLAKLVQRYVQGEGRDNDLAKLRVEARDLLALAGYTPEGGFPGDEALGIPPATAGSLRDLSSEKRLNLIFETQAQMMRGLGLKLRGITRAESHPAWELVRYKHAREIEWERDWLKRWKEAADNVEWQGVLGGQTSASAEDGRAGALPSRMVALKSSPIWRALGSSALFADALNVDHPPFAFNSGMGWREVKWKEAQALGLDIDTPQTFDAKTLADPALEPRPASPTMTAAERADKLARFQELQRRFQQRAARRA